MSLNYNPQGSGAPPPVDHGLPLTDPSGNDQFTNLINWTAWHQWCALPPQGWVIALWISLYDQLVAAQTRETQQ
jgi:hypothetical protein